jgi:hypothetical protein
MSEEEIVDDDLDFLDEFIQSTLNDREYLKYVFDKRISARFKRIGFSEKKIASIRDEMIHKLDFETSIDLVKGSSGICCNMYTAHTRKKGEELKRGPGIWFGEKTVRYLAEKYDKKITPPVLDYLYYNDRDIYKIITQHYPLDLQVTGREFFAALLLEEAQHMFAPPVAHGKLQRPEDYGKLIEHDAMCTNTLGTIKTYLQNPLFVGKLLRLVREKGPQLAHLPEISELDPEYTESSSILNIPYILQLLPPEMVGIEDRGQRTEDREQTIDHRPLTIDQTGKEDRKRSADQTDVIPAAVPESRKSEIRNPKNQTNTNDQNEKIQNKPVSDLDHSDLKIVSDLDIRNSDLNNNDHPPASSIEDLASETSSSPSVLTVQKGSRPFTPASAPLQRSR